MGNLVWWESISPYPYMHAQAAIFICLSVALLSCWNAVLSLTIDDVLIFVYLLSLQLDSNSAKFSRRDYFRLFSYCIPTRRQHRWTSFYNGGKKTNFSSCMLIHPELIWGRLNSPPSHLMKHYIKPTWEWNSNFVNVENEHSR